MVMRPSCVSFASSPVSRSSTATRRKRSLLRRLSFGHQSPSKRSEILWMGASQMSSSRSSRISEARYTTIRRKIALFPNGGCRTCWRKVKTQSTYRRQKRSEDWHFSETSVRSTRIDTSPRNSSERWHTFQIHRPRNHTQAGYSGNGRKQGT